ncbi:hypothetical protein [Micromonospora sp. NPDC048169]|uniref:hypothetical protein n=1 Tax=unclassified Micromonospora TaxID=2617518 RepID=UPI0034070AEB
MTAAVIAASASVLVAVLVFTLNQIGQFRQERRQAKLSRINSQLRDLYGPLNALVDVNERIWTAMRSEGLLPAQSERTPEGGTDVWRRWRDHALQPANRRMRDLIIEHADLLIGVEVPQVFRDFCAHVAAQEIVIEGEDGHVKEAALIRHPGANFVAHVHEAFAALKKEQAALLHVTTN